RTLAPCSAKVRAVSAPMPDAPPVTIATLPFSLLPGCTDRSSRGVRFLVGCPAKGARSPARTISVHSGLGPGACACRVESCRSRGLDSADGDCRHRVVEAASEVLSEAGM